MSSKAPVRQRSLRQIGSFHMEGTASGAPRAVQRALSLTQPLMEGLALNGLPRAKQRASSLTQPQMEGSGVDLPRTEQRATSMTQLLMEGSKPDGVPGAKGSTTSQLEGSTLDAAVRARQHVSLAKARAFLANAQWEGRRAAGAAGTSDSCRPKAYDPYSRLQACDPYAVLRDRGALPNSMASRVQTCRVSGFLGRRPASAVQCAQRLLCVIELAFKVRDCLWLDCRPLARSQLVAIAS